MAQMKPETRLALQLYSVRSAGNFAARCALAHHTGYRWVETEATYGLSRTEFCQLLHEYQLGLISMHVDLHELADLNGLMEIMQACQCQTLVMPWLDEAERPQDYQAWMDLAQRLQNYAQTLASNGLRLAYHNHAFELATLATGECILDCILQHAPAVYWQADLAWVARAGAPVTRLIERYAARIISVHVKDLHLQRHSVAENDWAILGQGDLPWPAYLEKLSPELTDYIVEHDQPLDAATMANQGLRQLQRWLSGKV